MRSKAPLAMMEQMVMVLVFALAAALCLQAFVKSDRMSKEMEARDRAVVLCQNVAETIRSTGGNWEETCDLLGMPFPNAGMYDENWTPVDVGDSVYQLWIEPLDSGVDGLGKAKISVTKYGLNVIFEIEAAWQEEVGSHG